MPREPHDPTRLLRFVARHAINGVVAGWVCLLLLIWLDVGGVGTMLDGSSSGDLATAMLAIGFGATFSLIGIGWGVLFVLPDEPSEERRR